jgi:hypothetical protein
MSDRTIKARLRWTNHGDTVLRIGPVLIGRVVKQPAGNFTIHRYKWRGFDGGEKLSFQTIEEAQVRFTYQEPLS